MRTPPELHSSDVFGVAPLRTAAVRALRTAITEQGGDLERCARLAGLTPGALDGNPTVLTIDDLGAVLKTAALEMGRPDLGLRVAEHQDLSALGPLGWVIGSCDTVADAFSWIDRYCQLRAPAVTLLRDPDPHHLPAILGVHLNFGAVALSPHLNDWSLALLHRTLTALLGGTYELRSVEMRCSPAVKACYEAFFGAPVRIARNAPMLRIGATVLSRPIHTSNPHVVRLAEAMLVEHSDPVGPRAAASIRSAVRQHVGTPGSKIDVIAAQLAIHPRTLQRHLAAEGATFAEVLDDVRKTEARRYLLETDLSFTRVAGLLGLSSQSALTRCCRRWWSRTPTQVRVGGLPL